MRALKTLGPEVVVNKPLTTHTDPILTITYTPSPPDLTIRTIVAAISMAGQPSTNFTAAIHRPPSLEDRARHMQRREQRHLLWRLLFSVVAAIPTFILGIVYMTLVPAENPTRMWLEEPLWAGNASRAEWALFFLATPVMFYSAGMFHRRSLKEIYALWRKGSRIPVWKRFIRFGSMNLLVRTEFHYYSEYSSLTVGLSGVHRGGSSLFCIHRLACPRCRTRSFSIWHGRHYDLF